MFTIKNEQKDQLSIDPQGAKITVQLHGVEVLGIFKRGDNKEGRTHPCSPIFGPDRKSRFGLKQHGNMRNETCDVKQVAGTFLVSHKVSDEGYPKGLFVKQIMTIEEGIFSFVMIHTNTGKEAVPVNAGEHCYFTAPNGYKGTKINGHDISSLIEKNHDGFPIDLKEENHIQIPKQKEIILRQNGLKKAMLWVGKNPKSLEIDQDYICIEPVEDDPVGNFFGSKKSKILPGESRSAMFSLEIVD